MSKASKAFVEAYIEAMMWTDMNSDVTPEYDGSQQISDELRQQCEADCAAFYTENETLLNTSIDCRNGDVTCLDDTQCGHDFWLTRNRTPSSWRRVARFLGVKL